MFFWTFERASIHTSPIQTESVVQNSRNRMSNSRTSRRGENLACKLSRRRHYHLSGRGLLLAAAARALLASLALGATLALRAALALASLAGGSATAAFGGHDC